jgi:phosphoribosylglycinamide formyltransferase 1
MTQNSPSSKNKSPIKLGILLSGRGSNFIAIHQHLMKKSNTTINNNNAPLGEIALVLSNKSKAPGLSYAQQHNIPNAFVSAKAFHGNANPLESYDQELLKHLQSAEIDVVILAGYTKILSKVLIQNYPHRILNIHPSLLPKFGGVGMTGNKVHQAVLEAGELKSGCTVHIVTEAVDEGPILGQAEVIIEPVETVDSLAQKVLEQEHRLYPQIIEKFLHALLDSKSLATAFYPTPSTGESAVHY